MRPQRRLPSSCRKGRCLPLACRSEPWADNLFNEMAPLTADGHHRANGGKSTNIGNGQHRADGIDLWQDGRHSDYVFFVADYRHKNYELVQEQWSTPVVCGRFALRDYPSRQMTSSSKGRRAWDTALNTVMSARYNSGLGFIAHLHPRAVRSRPPCRQPPAVRHGVTDFPHVSRCSPTPTSAWTA